MLSCFSGIFIFFTYCIGVDSIFLLFVLDSFIDGEKLFLRPLSDVAHVTNLSNVQKMINITSVHDITRNGCWMTVPDTDTGLRADKAYSALIFSRITALVALGITGSFNESSK